MCRNGKYAVVKIDGRRCSPGRRGSPEAQQAYDRLIAEWLSNHRHLPLMTKDTSEDPPDEAIVTVSAEAVLVD